MKTGFLNSVVALFVLGSCVVAQESESYPWQVTAKSRSSYVTTTPGGEIPSAPKMGLINAIPQETEEVVVQPVVPALNQVPQAPVNQVYENVVPQVPLEVQGNTLPGEIDYCNPPQRNWCNLGCESRLFNRPIAGFQIDGFAQFGYHNRNILPFNNRRSEFNTHQVWLGADKTEQLFGRTVRWRADVVYGVDAQELQAIGNSPTGAPSGWDNGWDYGSYGWALPQLFMETCINDWTVRFGKFLSPIGYERAQATQNFFYSRTYTRAFTEPFSHSGVIAERNNGNFTQILGATAGWDTGFDSNDGGFNVISGLGVQPNERTRLVMMSSVGDTGYQGSGTLWTGVAEIQLTHKVQYVGQIDFLNLSNIDDFSFTNSLYYYHSDCLAFGSRLEWWKSNRFQPNMSSTYDFTMGANYRPHANWLIRPEVRWDWGADAVDNGEVVFGFDTIIKF